MEQMAAYGQEYEREVRKMEEGVTNWGYNSHLDRSGSVMNVSRVDSKRACYSVNELL